jgi:putative two-component system response regulator
VTNGVHCRHVVGLSLLVANALDLPMWQIRQLERVALLHDVGKIGIPDHVLLKLDKLHFDELVMRQTHVAIGASVVAAAFPKLG